MIPVVNALLAPDALQETINGYEPLRRLCEALRIETVRQLTMALLFGMMAIYVVKNLYILFLTYKQNAFITQNRNF